MNTQEIVAKLWNLCNVLRDDGITYHQYVTELTYILFLKMAKETHAEDTIPEDCRWDALRDLRGLDLKNHYKRVLDELGTETQGRVREIYAGAATNIDEPKNLEKIITSIDELDWFSAKEEGLGSLYEGHLYTEYHQAHLSIFVHLSHDNLNKKIYLLDIFFVFLYSKYHRKTSVISAVLSYHMPIKKG